MIKNYISFLVVPAIAVIILLFFPLDPENPKVTYTFCIALLMATWWITEIVPLAVTSLLPVALFPLFGVMDSKDVSASYFNDVIFLFMGGFLVALAMQRWQLHRRIALHILKITGVGPGRILMGFMIATAFLSMWISNTATAMMMLPIALSVIHQLEELSENKSIGNYSVAILLGVAYSASIGGVATLVGTPPNLSFVRIFHIYFPEAPQVSFTAWLVFALPFSILFLLITWLVLYLMYKPRNAAQLIVDRDTFRKQLADIGKTTYEEKVVFIVFVVLALLWLLIADLNFGAFRMKGWSSFLPAGKAINDGTVAIFMAIILFLIPSKAEPGKKILDWATASEMPWHILLLFGGGFALASGFKESGLAVWIGNHLQWVASYHVIFIILAISLIITFLTELTSNTATTEMVLPILAGIAISTGIHPLLLMIPATISASMAFMLPVATPPNAIVFSSSRISMAQMARTGLILNLVGAVVITLLMYFWGSYIFDINFTQTPEWLKQ
ncbi:MAG: SLC13/DASS family transporter [Bacteroidales bacterium]|nr:SLC13/DASS family transporter [Bacteroidales bacterium]